MSAFRDAAARELQTALVCPGCGEVNRSGVAPAIEVSQDWRTAFCTVCSRSGPIACFQLKGIEPC